MSKKKRSVNKRGVSIYISWVLLMAFVVILSTVMFSFMRGYAETSAEQIKERALSTLECDVAAVTIDYACQNTQNLYINVTNRGDIRIKEMLFRSYDLYYEPQVDEIDVSLLIGKYNSKEINLVKRGAVKKIRKIEVVPILLSEGIRIICENKVSYYPLGDEMIPDCMEKQS